MSNIFVNRNRSQGGTYGLNMHKQKYSKTAAAWNTNRDNGDYFKNNVSNGDPNGYKTGFSWQVNDAN